MKFGTDTIGAKRDRPIDYAKRSEPAPVSVLSREAWIELYTYRILTIWRHMEAPLGLAQTYTACIRRDLSNYYAQPLMRAFVEQTY